MPGASDTLGRSTAPGRPPRRSVDTLSLLAAEAGGRCAAHHPDPPGRVLLGEGVVVVAPLVQALLLRAMRRRAEAVPPPRPTRLVSRSQVVDNVAYVADRTSALLLRPGADLQVLPPGSLVLPTLLGTGTSTYAVVSHDPVDLWLRMGPFVTLDDRQVQQVELRLTVSLSDSPSGLRHLAEEAAASGPDGLDGFGDVLLDRLTRAVSARIMEAVRRRTLAELTGLSLGVLLDGALPRTFLGGLIDRSDLEVVDVDWPTEGRGWPASLPQVPGPSAAELSAAEPSAAEPSVARRAMPR